MALSYSDFVASRTFRQLPEEDKRTVLGRLGQDDQPAPAIPSPEPLPWETIASSATFAGLPDEDKKKLEDQHFRQNAAFEVRREAAKQGVNPVLMASLLTQESGGDPTAVSPMGATGLMQLMSGAATDMGVDPAIPSQNVRGGVGYFKRQLEDFGDEDAALAAYYAGPGRVRQAMAAQDDWLGWLDANVSRPHGQPLPSAYISQVRSRGEAAPTPTQPTREPAMPTVPAPPPDTALPGIVDQAQAGAGQMPRFSPEQFQHYLRAIAPPGTDYEMEYGPGLGGMAARTAGNLASGFATLFAGLADIVPYVADTLTSDPGEYGATVQGFNDFADFMREKAQEMSPADPQFVDKAIAGLATSIGFMIPGAMFARAAFMIPKVSPLIATAIGVGAATVEESMMEGADVYDGLLKQGMPQEEAESRAHMVTAKNIATLAATNAAGGLFNPTQRSIIRRALQEMPASAVEEGLQEVWQLQAQDMPVKDHLHQISEAAALGGVIGGTMGVGLGAYDRVRGEPTVPVPPEEAPVAEPAAPEVPAAPPVEGQPTPEGQPPIPDFPVVEGRPEPEVPPLDAEIGLGLEEERAAGLAAIGSRRADQREGGRQRITDPDSPLNKQSTWVQRHEAIKDMERLLAEPGGIDMAAQQMLPEGASAAEIADKRELVLDYAQGLFEAYESAAPPDTEGGPLEVAEQEGVAQRHLETLAPYDTLEDAYDAMVAGRETGEAGTNDLEAAINWAGRRASSLLEQYGKRQLRSEPEVERQPATTPTAEEVTVAAEEAATSPTNEIPEPTEAQKEVGNYRHGHIKMHGLDISIENPKGSERSGTDPDGTPWSVVLGAHYGYIRRSIDADGEQVDVYVGDQPESDRVFVVDQKDLDTDAFDEHKAFVGFPDQAAVEQTYDAAFDDGRGPERRAAITEMSVDEFKAWLKEGDTTAPVQAEVAPDAEPVVEPEADITPEQVHQAVDEAVGEGQWDTEQNPDFGTFSEIMVGTPHIDNMDQGQRATILEQVGRGAYQAWQEAGKPDTFAPIPETETPTLETTAPIDETIAPETETPAVQEMPVEEVIEPVEQPGVTPTPLLEEGGELAAVPEEGTGEPGLLPDERPEPGGQGVQREPAPEEPVEVDTQTQQMFARPGARVKPGPSPDDAYEVAESTFTYPSVIGSGTARVNDLIGGVGEGQREQQRVKDLADKIRESGRFDRIIIDTQNNVIEGQHRLQAARLLGLQRIPVTRVADLEQVAPIEKMQRAVQAEGLHHDQARQIAVNAAESIAEAGGAENLDPAEYGTGNEYYDRLYGIAYQVAKDDAGTRLSRMGDEDIAAAATDPAVTEELTAIAQRLAPQAAFTAEPELRDEAGREIQGIFETQGKEQIIRVALAGNPVESLGHESIHALKQAGLFTDAEWAGLERAAQENDWLGTFNIPDRYADLDTAGQLEEAVASAFGRYLTEGEVAGITGEAEQPSMLRRVFDRLRTFFRDVGRALRGGDTEVSPTNIFEEVQSGQLAARQPEQQTAADARQPATTDRKYARAMDAEEQGAATGEGPTLLVENRSWLRRAGTEIAGTTKQQMQQTFGKEKGAALYNDQYLYGIKKEFNATDIGVKVTKAFTNKEVWDRIRNIPVLGWYLGERGTAMTVRLLRRASNSFAKQFSVSKEEQETLFDAAEAANHIDPNGQIVWGTEDVVRDEKGEPVMDADGNPKMQTRFTPEDGKLLWAKLSDQGKESLMYWVTLRQQLKEQYKVESDLQGYVHHYFPSEREGDMFKAVEGILLKRKEAGARKRRKGAEGFEKDLEKSVTRYWTLMENERLWNDFTDKLIEDASEPVSEDTPLKEGWKEIPKSEFSRGAHFSRKLGAGRQVPAEFYEDFMRFAELTQETSELKNTVRSLGRFFKTNMLIHPGTAVTNAISGAIQYMSKIVDDFWKLNVSQGLWLYNVMSGKAEPKPKDFDQHLRRLVADITAPLEALRPSVIEKLPPELFGAMSNARTQFGPAATFMDRFNNVALWHYGAIENYWKRAIMLSELKAQGMPAEGMNAQDLIGEHTDALLKAGDVVDTYAFNYANQARWITRMKQHWAGALAFPFPTYPYKLGHYYARYIGAMNPLTWKNLDGGYQEGASRFLTMMTAMGLGMGLMDDEEKDKVGPWVPGMASALDKTGRLHFPALDEKAGTERWVRVIKYPWLNLISGMDGGGKALQALWEDRSPAEGTGQMSEVLQEMIGEGPLIAGLAILTGYGDEFSQYKTTGTKLGELAASFVPGPRISQELSSMSPGVQQYPTNFLQAFIRGTPLPDSWTGLGKVSEDKASMIDGQYVLHKPTLNQLKFWLGITIKEIDVKTYQFQKRRTLVNIMKAISDAESVDAFDRAVARLDTLDPRRAVRLKKQINRRRILIQKMQRRRIKMFEQQAQRQAEAA